MDITKKENEFDGILYNNNIQFIIQYDNKIKYSNINYDSIDTNMNYSENTI